jgi:hypothetical protein
MLVPATPAVAQSSLHADRAAWFWSSNQDITTCGGGFCGATSGTGGIQSNGQGVASPASPGHMAVGMKNGSSDQRAYVHFDTATIPANSTISSFVVRLTVSSPSDQKHVQEHGTFTPQSDGRGHAPGTTNPRAASIVACLASEPFGDNLGGGGGGDPPYSTLINEGESGPPEVTTSKNEPSVDCSLNAEGKAAADGLSWSFDITRIAQVWASGQRYNEGIALLPQASGIGPTWTVEFHGPPLTLEGKAGQVRYVTAAEAPVASASFVAAGGTVLPPVSDPGVIPPPPTYTGPIDSGPANPPGDLSNPPPVAPVPQTVGPVIAAAFHGKTPLWVWILLPLVVFGVWLLQGAIGVDPITESATSVGVDNRVAQVLQLRRLLGGGTPQAAEAIKAQELSEPDA